MSPITQFGVLAFASAVLAVPNAHHQHQHLHARDAPAYSWSSSQSRPSGTMGSQSHHEMPQCWSTCFHKYNAEKDQLCGATGASVKSCIDTSCKNSPELVKKYDAWVDKFCGSAAGPTGSGTGTAAVSPVTSTLPAGYSTSVAVETTTQYMQSQTLYSTYYVTHTLFEGQTVTSPVNNGGTPTSVGQNVNQVSPAAETCGQDVTVTTKIYETVTVTAGADEGKTLASSTTEAAKNFIPPQYSQQNTWSQTTGSPETSETQSVVQSTSSADSTSAAPVISSPAASSATESPTSVASSPSPSSTSGGSGTFGKKGLGYNTASDCTPFYGKSQVGWGYNWASSSGGIDTSKVSYIPTLWGNGPDKTGSWDSDAKTAIAQGAEYFFSFNEPDISSQANMSPQEAVTAWNTYMEPYAKQVKLVAPAVSNGAGTSPLMGLDWLSEFLNLCTGCTIHAVNQHWYDSTSNDADYFKTQVSNATTISGGKPVFVTEWSATGSDTDVSDFMNEVIPWMESNNDVLGYAYTKVGDGYLNDGTGLSAIGKTYCEAS